MDITTYNKWQKSLIEETDNIFEFWIYHAIDRENGGFYGEVSNENIPHETADKSAILNARLLWSLSKYGNMFGNIKFQIQALNAYQYSVNHFFDKEYGGNYWSVDYLGNPKEKRKQVYALAFYIYALAEFNQLTENEEAKNYAIQFFYLIEKHSFDREKNGYIEAFTQDWGELEDVRLSEKDRNEKKTMNTHLHILEAYTNLYRVWKNQELLRQIENMIELFLERFVDNKTFTQNLFFDVNWNLKSGMISYGHDIETSWLLTEAAKVTANQGLIDKVSAIAVKMVDAVVPHLDYDSGLIYEYDPERNHLDSDKHWWPQAEAMVGFLNAYQISGDDKYLKHSKNSWRFIQQYLIDHEKGEWFRRVNKAGRIYVDDEKVGFWKCPYHNSRACMELIERLEYIKMT